MTSWFERSGRFEDPVGAARIGLFVDLLSRFPTGHVVDLGAGHGMFSRIAADLGWRVTAVDARADRFPRDERIRWVVSDARDFDEYDDVDVVVCLGLWYHLTLDDQLGLASRLAPRPLVLDTHVAMPDPRDHAAHGARLGDLVEHDGYAGRLYSERGLESAPTASWHNEESFWPTPGALERQLYEGGYELVEHVSPPFLSDRRYHVARTLGGPQAHARLDTITARLDALVAPDAPASPVRLSSWAAPAAPAAPAPAPRAPRPAKLPAGWRVPAALVADGRRAARGARTLGRRVRRRIAGAG